MHTDVDYLETATFDTFTLQMGRKSAKLSETTETIAIVWLIVNNSQL